MASLSRAMWAYHEINCSQGVTYSDKQAKSTCRDAGTALGQGGRERVEGNLNL